MPAGQASLTVEDVRRFVRERCLSESGHERVGIELEWLTFAPRDPRVRLPIDDLQRAAARAQPLPSGSMVTFEPGGQLELSSAQPLPLGRACDQMAADVDAMTRAVADDGIRLVGYGLDPIRPDRRVLHVPRYDAMESYFDADGASGRRMMCGTAAVQVNLDVGRSDQRDQRWRLAHDIGPMLAAAFANSPLAGDRPTGYLSTRLATWSALDRTRCAAPDLNVSAIEGWSRYILDACVMVVREGTGRFIAMDRSLPFSRWIDEGHHLGYPTLADLEYHLTTLFPPVRARGWLEVRMVDMLPDPWWRVPVAVAAALLYDEEAGERAASACVPVRDSWDVAAQRALRDPALAGAARTCIEAASAALGRLGADSDTRSAVDGFAERYVDAGRCPAEDVLDSWRAGRSPLGDDAFVDAPAWSA